MKEQNKVPLDRMEQQWWNRIMHKKFHIGWVFAVCITGIIVCIVALSRLV
jgi:hypothetical protein